MSLKTQANYKKVTAEAILGAKPWPYWLPAPIFPRGIFGIVLLCDGGCYFLKQNNLQP